MIWMSAEMLFPLTVGLSLMKNSATGSVIVDTRNIDITNGALITRAHNMYSTTSFHLAARVLLSQNT